MNATLNVGYCAIHFFHIKNDRDADINATKRYSIILCIEKEMIFTQVISTNPVNAILQEMPEYL